VAKWSGTKVTDTDRITEIDAICKSCNPLTELKVTRDFDKGENLNQVPFDGFAMPDSAVTANMLEIVAEVTDYWKQYLDNRAAFVEKLLGAKSFDSAVQIQSEYAKTSFEGFVVQATKMGELYSNLAKSASIRLDWRWPTPKA
jgi:hypothetical protein